MQIRHGGSVWDSRYAKEYSLLQSFILFWLPSRVQLVHVWWVTIDFNFCRYNKIDERVLIGALPFRSMTNEVSEGVQNFINITLLISSDRDSFPPRRRWLRVLYSPQNSLSFCYPEKNSHPSRLVDWLWFYRIDLAYTNRMQLTACRISFWFNFYGCLEIAKFRSRMTSPSPSPHEIFSSAHFIAILSIRFG